MVHWRAVAVAVAVDYLAFGALAVVGAALPSASMFYALASPARLAPLAAGLTAGVVAVDRSRTEPTAVSGVSRGLGHGLAVVGVVLAVGLAGALGLTPLWPVLPVGVLAAGGWRLWQGDSEHTPRRVALAAGTVLGALVLALPRLRTLIGALVWTGALLPRVGSFALVGVAEFGRGWTLLAAWSGLLVLGSLAGGLLATARAGRGRRRQPRETPGGE